jgi:D-glycero-D-manno-heptose 1,7-bisphosphate phosphatase
LNPLDWVREAAASARGHAAVPPIALRPHTVTYRRAVFLDQDGTLVDDVPGNVDPAQLRFTPHALEALQVLDRAGYALVVVGNQAGLAAGRVTRAGLARLQRALGDRVWLEAGVELAGFYTCPHAPASAPAQACLCRMPAPGMLRQAALSQRLDLQRSWMVGDILDDVEAGHRAGCRTVLLDVGNETQWRRSPLRAPGHRAHDLLEAARTLLAADALADAAAASARAARADAALALQ